MSPPGLREVRPHRRRARPAPGGTTVKQWGGVPRSLLGVLERPVADGLFALLLFGCVVAAGWLIARHDRYWDWTDAGANSLGPESVAIVRRLEAPLRATVFADAEDPRGKVIGRLLERYRRELPGFSLRFVDPQRFPEQARDARVAAAGQVMLDYRGRRETLERISERDLSAAIARLSAARAPWIAVLEGHGERHIEGTAPADLGRLGEELKQRGFSINGLDLMNAPDIPANTDLLIVSRPEIALFPGEAARLAAYLERGGNLLWLVDPGPLNGLEVLADALGIGVLPGIVVDARAAQFQSETAAMAVIAEFPKEPPWAGLKAPALLPGAVAFEDRSGPDWTLEGTLMSGPDSWNETGRIEGKVFRDEVVGERAGPLPVVLALSRPLGEEGRTQRVLVAGDGDFLSNAQLGAFGNRELALAMVRWASAELGLFALPADPAAPVGLALEPGRRLLLGLGALLVLPAFFIVCGFTVRWLRARG